LAFSSHTKTDSKQKEQNGARKNLAERK